MAISDRARLLCALDEELAECDAELAVVEEAEAIVFEEKQKLLRKRHVLVKTLKRLIDPDKNF